MAAATGSSRATEPDGGAGTASGPQRSFLEFVRPRFAHEIARATLHKILREMILHGEALDLKEILRKEILRKEILQRIASSPVPSFEEREYGVQRDSS